MDKSKGIAFCGLACAACSEAVHCPGCRSAGCANNKTCKNFQCCTTRSLDGCWECSDFPCTGTILDKLRIRTFANFVKAYGTTQLVECLERNERSGIRYHHPGKITGDYDIPQSEQGIVDMLLSGKQPH